VTLHKRLPTYSERLGPTECPNKPFPCCFFANPLVIPLGYGTVGFDQKSALDPKYRVTNIGFQIITIEHDCETTDELEECLRWTRGGDGDFNKSPFAAVDRELTRFKEYRGYTIVFTGNRSIHFHFVFNTKHLDNAPWDLIAADRLGHSQADLLNQAHQTY
jgi:hypothetical protein